MRSSPEHASYTTWRYIPMRLQYSCARLEGVYLTFRYYLQARYQPYALLAVLWAVVFYGDGFRILWECQTRCVTFLGIKLLRV